jgi:hypothetical protein
VKRERWRCLGVEAALGATRFRAGFTTETRRHGEEQVKILTTEDAEDRRGKAVKVFVAEE